MTGLILVALVLVAIVIMLAILLPRHGRRRRRYDLEDASRLQVLPILRRRQGPGARSVQLDGTGDHDPRLAGRDLGREATTK